jgi:hypothetical protein
MRNQNVELMGENQLPKKKTNSASRLNWRHSHDSLLDDLAGLPVAIGCDVDVDIKTNERTNASAPTPRDVP